MTTSDTPSGSMATHVYRIMDSNVDARLAIDDVMRYAKKELAIVDLSPAALREREFGRPTHIETMRTLLRASRNHKICIALHETQGMEIEVPRLVALAIQFSDQMHIHRTLGAAREIQDVMLLADADAVWRKPVAVHPRSVLTIGSEADVRPYMERFSEIWASSERTLMDRTTGL